MAEVINSNFLGDHTALGPKPSRHPPAVVTNPGTKTWREPAAGCCKRCLETEPVGASEAALVPACLLQGGHEPPDPKPALFTQKETGANIEVGGQHLVALRGAGTSLLGFLTVMQGSGRGGRGPWGGSALPDSSPHPSGPVHAPPRAGPRSRLGKGL